MSELYRFRLRCPVCEKVSQATAAYRAAMVPPRFRCGDCLAERVEVVTMTITAVEEIVQRFYIEIRRPNGVLEFFHYQCQTADQAARYARDKARAYGGKVLKCRASTAVLR